MIRKLLFSFVVFLSLSTASLAMSEVKGSDPASLFSTEVQKEDYIRVAPGGRYFVHSDGRPYIPLGYNHNPDWTPLHMCDPKRREYNPKATEAFFRKLKGSGVNLIRLMLETPGSGLLEDPIGTFRPEHVKWIDHIVTFAVKYDIKLLVTPWDTFWMNHKWDICPYNNKLGGPVVEKIDFLTKPEVKEAQKRRLKYIIDRWGNTGAIFAWDLLNEIDLWWGGSPEQIRAWIVEMAGFVRDYESKKWGRNHLLTVSFAHPMPGGEMANVAYNMKELDFSNTHLYIDESKAPTEPVTPAITENRGVVYALKTIKDGRPYLDSESGPIDDWIEDGKLDDAVFHNMSWAHLASGGAGSGLRWPYRHPHHLSDGMFDTLRLMSKFTKIVPWDRLWRVSSSAPKVEAPDGLVAFCTGGAEAAILWATAKDPQQRKETSLTLTWPNGPARVKYRAYDTKQGVWFDLQKTECTNGKITIPLAGTSSSIAVLIEGE